jgi:type IX secretion system PorP/SprF family membrane protein
LRYSTLCKIKGYSIIILTLIFSNINGQDIQFSQFYSAPLYLNPAFAGSAHHYRGILHQRLQWPNITGKFTTSLFSFDKYFNKYKSGIALMAIQDYQGTNAISSSQVGLQYAYELHVSEKLTIRPGLQLDYVSKSLNYDVLRFPRNFDSTGYLGGAMPQDLTGRKSFADVSTGVVLYSDKLWVAISAHHINTPNQSFLGNVSRLPAKFTFISGYKIPLTKKVEHESVVEDVKDISITPTVHYKFQGKSDQLDLGLYGIYDQALIALWYRGIPIKQYHAEYVIGNQIFDQKFPNNESMVVVLGWMWKSISITYSYDFTISKLSQARTGGSHELNLTFIQHKHHKSVKPMRRLPCPHFYKK